MREWFDIFQVDMVDAPVWIGAAESLQSAEGKVAELMKENRFDFMIYSHRTGEKWVIPGPQDSAAGAGADSVG